MLDSLYIAATGMDGHQSQINVISNNLANLNTPAFKKSRVDFEDLVYRIQGGSAFGRIEAMPVGAGSAPLDSGKIFTSGEYRRTGKELDLAIRGDGFFEVVLPDGSNAYSRAGSFRLDADGLVVDMNGYPLSPLIYVPSDASGLTVEANGTVLVTVGDGEKPVQVGRIELGRFVNPAGLKPLGSNLYVPTEDSGDAFYEVPDEISGSVMQGYLEGSNVDLVEEMTSLMLAQRAYEINAKVAQISDEILGIVNGLRR